jgi:hypothetical protein
LKVLKIAVGAFFIIVGILFFIFLRELNDPEIEGDSGRIGWDTYYLCLIPIIIGLIILLLQINSKKSN